MSSHDDKEAQDAKIARLKARLDIHKDMSDARIKELEQKVTDLELDKRLSAMKVQDQAPRPAVSTGSSDPALQAEILQLRQDVAAKDDEVSNLHLLSRNCEYNLTAIRQGFVALQSGFHETTEDLSAVVQDIHHVLDAQIAFRGLWSRPRSPVADTAAGPPQPSQSAPKTSSTLDYAQALKSPVEKLPRLPRAKVPLEQSPVYAGQSMTHANLAVKKEADQARSDTERQKTSQKPNRVTTRGGPAQGNARGRGHKRGRGNSRSNKGETSHDSTSKEQSPVTHVQHPGSESTQVTAPGSLEKRVESRDTNVTTGSDQTPKKPEAESSVTTPATQAGRTTLVDKDKKVSSDPSSAPIARRRRKMKLTEDDLAHFLRWGYAIPSETDTHDEGPPSKPEDRSLVATPGTQTRRQTLVRKIHFMLRPDS